MWAIGYSTDMNTIWKSDSLNREYEVNKFKCDIIQAVINHYQLEKNNILLGYFTHWNVMPCLACLGINKYCLN
jgi:hypothetical protein